MAKLETWYKQDLKRPLVVHKHTDVFNQDSKGNLIGVEVYSDGEPVALSGSISGYCLLADGTTVPAVGASRSGNKASVLIPQTAYSVPGPITITIKNVDGENIATLCATVGIVRQSVSGNLVNPGSVVTDWSNDINAQLQAVQTAVDNVGAIVAAPFDENTVYVVGNYVTNNGNLYRITADHASGVAWASTAKIQCTVGHELEALNNHFVADWNLIDPDAASSEETDFLPVELNIRYNIIHAQSKGRFQYGLSLYDSNKTMLYISQLVDESTDGTNYSYSCTFSQSAIAYVKLKINSAPSGIDTTDFSKVYFGKGSEYIEFDDYNVINAIKKVKDDVADLADEISDLNSALGTVPSGKTAQGQIDDNANDISDLKSAIKQNSIVPFTGTFDTSVFRSGYINTNLSVGDVCDYETPVSNVSFLHVVVFGIKPAEKFFVSGKGTVKANLWAWLDANGIVLELGIAGSTQNNREIIAPTNAAILVCNFNKTITPYGLYREINIDSLYERVSNAEETLSEDELFTLWNIDALYRYSKNIFDKSTEIENHYVSESTGELIANNNYNASDWIPIYPNTDYLITQNSASTKTGLRFAVYDMARNYITGALNTRQIPATENAYWLRVSYPKTATTIQVEKGTAATAYVEYSKEHPSTAGEPIEIYPVCGRTKYGENMAYPVEENSANWTLQNTTYVTDFTDNHGEQHDGYLLETPLVNGVYAEASISASYTVEEGKDYFVGAYIPYVNNPVKGGRTHWNYKLTFGEQEHTGFGNNDGNFSQIFTAQSTETITVKIGSVAGEYWKAQVVNFYIFPITQFITEAATIIPRIQNPKTLRVGLTGMAMGGGHSKLFDDQASFDFGSREALNNKPSIGNTAFGDGAQARMTTGFYNTAFGYQCQAYMTTGSFNVALGRSAQSMMTAGEFNIGIGQVAQHAMQTGSWNIAIGNETQRDLANGNNNVSIGRRVHNSLQTGSGNTCVGSRAGFYPNATINGNNQTLIGMESSMSDDTVESESPTALGAYTKAANYATALGANVEANGEGSVAIGVDKTGNPAIASADNEVVIGTAAHTIKLAGHTIVFNQDGSVSWS